MGRSRAKTAYIEPGSPWENGYIERSFNARLRDELLNGEIIFQCGRPGSSSAVASSLPPRARTLSQRGTNFDLDIHKQRANLISGYPASLSSAGVRHH